MAKIIKEAGTDKQIIISNYIVARPLRRTNFDIAAWRQALEFAELKEAPNRVLLYDIYADALLDPHLNRQWNKRVENITRTKWVYTVNGKPDEALNVLIHSPEFEQLLVEIMNALAWGISVLELGIEKRKFFDSVRDMLTIYSVPRKHIRPEEGVIVKEQYDTADSTVNGSIHYRQGNFPDYVGEIGKPDDLGLLLNAVPYVLLKKGAVSDWALFVQLFGQPFREYRYSGYDESVRQLLEKSAQEMASSPYIILPDGAELKMHDAKSNVTGEIHSKLVQYCDEMISIYILGNTETTKSSKTSGYGQALVHSDTQNDVYEADKHRVFRILNTIIRPILYNLGFSVKEGTFHPKEEKNLDRILKRLEVIQVVKNLGVPVADELVYDSSDLPKPDNYEELKTAQEGLKATPNFTVPALVAGRMQDLKDLYKGCGHPTSVPDLLSDDEWLKLIEDIIGKLYNGEIAAGAIPESLYTETADELIKALDEEFLKKDWSYDDPMNAIAQRMKGNIFMFSGAKSLEQMKLYSGLLLDENGQLRPFNQFKKTVLDLHANYNRHFLKVEYNNAVAQAQMAVNWNQYNDDDWLEYSTAGDERVRDDHKKLEGIVQKKSSSFWKTYWPPNGWNCRCTVVPATAPDKPDSEKAALKKAKGALESDNLFANNAGESGIVFTNKHPYFQQAGDVSELEAVRHYGIKPVGDRLKEIGLPEAELLQNPKEFNQWWKDMADDFGEGNNQFVLGDALKQKVFFSGSGRNTFRQHLLADEKKLKQAGNIPKLVLDPDEVWMQGDGSTYQYVKYYNNGMHVLTVSNDKKLVKAVDYSVQKTKGESLRKGTLMHRK